MNNTLLLDTHIWVWMLLDERQHSTIGAWNEITRAATRQKIAISDISFWEVALKASHKKLDVGDIREWLRRARQTPGLAVVEVDRAILIDSTLLDFENRDPADRILISTALRYGLTLVTADKAIIGYAARNPRLTVLNATNN